MRALTVSEIIRLWETVRRQHAVDRALSMLQLVLPEHSREELAIMPLGQRDAVLLSVRKATFGERMPCTGHCPACSGTVEFELDCNSLLANTSDPHQEQVSADGYDVTVRPLNSYDLAAAASAETVANARAILLSRCVVSAFHAGRAIEAAALPAEIEGLIAQAASAADPQAELLLELDCPECRHSWRSALDIGHVLWLELGARAQRLLMEVHLLASAYGWGEAEILRLSSRRRAAYVAMVMS